MAPPKSSSRKSKSPDSSDVLPDQYLFINKSAKSSSLSSSNAGERFYIHSHVHSKHHKNKQQQTPPTPSSDYGGISRTPSQSKVFTWQSMPPEKPTIAATTDQLASLSTQTPSSEDFSASGSDIIDPSLKSPSPLPETSRLPIDETDRKLLHHVFGTFVTEKGSSEYPDSNSQIVEWNRYKHQKAIDDRLQACVADPLTMYTTLSYCASCWRWTNGGTEGEQRPPEYYMLKAIEALRPRVQNAEQVNPYMIQAIYALAVSEMWSYNYQPATTHLNVIRHLVLQAGGFRILKPHLREGLLLCDKYTAIGKFSRPVFFGDWEPDDLPKDRLQDIQRQVRSLLPDLARGFLDFEDEGDGHPLGQDILGIIGDVIPCVKVAVYSRIQGGADPLLQRWLFMQHQHLISRLLALDTMPTQLQECVRVALIMWLLKITKYFGAQRWARWLAPRLRDELLQLKKGADTCTQNMSMSLVFWMCHLGAIVSEDSTQRWFLQQLSGLTGVLQIQTDRASFEGVLSRYFFLQTEAGPRFERVLEALA